MSHIYEHRNFIIFNTSEINKIDFNSVLETGPETLRYSIDNQKTFVKWDGEMPECVGDLVSKEGPYSYEEMLQILDGSDWTDPYNSVY